MELPIELMFALSLVSSALVWLLRLAFKDRGREVPAWVYSVLLYGVSLGLALVFSPVSLPPFPPFTDLASGLAALMIFLGELIPILSAIVGFATLIYQVLLKRVLEGLGDALRRAVSVGSDIG